MRTPPTGYPVAPPIPRRRLAAKEIGQRGAYALVCLAMHVVVLAACAKMDALRLSDLAVTLVTLAVAYALAIRDSNRLASFLLAVWVLSRLVRRLIDWRLGGFESLTALSLLPMMATLTLLVPTLPRWKRIPHGVQQSLMLMGLPIAAATAIGLVSYGKAAVIDAAGWLVPMLFVPYFASRPTDAAVRRRMLRHAVGLAALVAAYGWFQFLYLPPWDAMWLTQSGMTSSMGLAEVNSVRVWGSLSSTGPAAGYWAAALGLLMCGVRPGPARGLFHGTLIGSVLLLSRVRVCWLSPFVGLAVFATLRGRRGSSEAVSLGLAAAAIVGVVTLLPGGDLVTSRLGSFGNLAQDDSFRTRARFVGEIFEMVIDTPFGRGIGYISAAKVRGNSAELTSFDNGFGAVAYSLGLPGALLWGLGVMMLAKQLLRAARQGDPSCRLLAIAGAVQLAMSFASLASAYFMGGESSILMWMAVGLALAPQPVPTTPCHAESQR